VSARGKLSTEEVALAFLIGVGLTLMILAGGLGTAFAGEANPSLYGMIFALGLVAFLAGVALWMAFVRPWTQFDDINVPLDSGHGHGDH
jgi:hypothetical protein